MRAYVVLPCLFASACSLISARGANGRRCDSTGPAADAIWAATSFAAAIGFGGEASTPLVALGALFAASATLGVRDAGACDRRGAAPIHDQFLGARTWSSSIAVKGQDSLLVAFEHTYQRAAVVCAGRGFDALTTTPFGPQRPERMTLVYQCHP